MQIFDLNNEVANEKIVQLYFSLNCDAESQIISAIYANIYNKQINYKFQFDFVAKNDTLLDVDDLTRVDLLAINSKSQFLKQ